MAAHIHRHDLGVTFPVRPISVLRFWISEGSTQAESWFEGWTSHVRRGFPGKFESTNLSRDDLSSIVGRLGVVVPSGQTVFVTWYVTKQCQRLCIYIYIYIYDCICIIYIYIYVYIYLYISIYIYIHIVRQAPILRRGSLCMRTSRGRKYMHTRIYVYDSLSLYIHAYIYIYI